MFSLDEQEFMLPVKIGDFGLARFLHAEESLTSNVGTPVYRAPEVFTKMYDQQSDLYSLGCVLWEVLNLLSARERQDRWHQVVAGQEGGNIVESHTYLPGIEEDILKLTVQDKSARTKSINDLKFVPSVTNVFVSSTYELRLAQKVTERPVLASRRSTYQHLDWGNGKNKTATMLLGGAADYLDAVAFLTVAHEQFLTGGPPVVDTKQNGYLLPVLYYLFHQVKICGWHKITTEWLLKNVSQGKDDTKSSIGNGDDRSIPKRPKFFRIRMSPRIRPVVKDPSKSGGRPIARWDVLTGFFHISEPLVYMDLMKNLSRYRQSLPLILQNLSTAEDTYICLMPLLKHISFKWETLPGQAQYNSLFVDPWKMVTAIRLGSAKENGKSKILNQLLNPTTMFSSKRDPGPQPLTVHGAVEFCVLTEETTSSSFWTERLCQYYKDPTNRNIILVSNVHGDFFAIPEDTVRLLKKLTSEFVVYVMPMPVENFKRLDDDLLKRLGKADWENRVNYILVDPTEDCRGSVENEVFSFQLTDASTTKTMSRIITDIANNSTAIFPLDDSESPSNEEYGSTLVMLPAIATNASNRLLQYVRKAGCEQVKKSLKCQRLQSDTPNYIRTLASYWNNDNTIRDEVALIVAFVNLPLAERLMAYSQLERELAALSSAETREAKQNIGALIKERNYLSHNNMYSYVEDARVKTVDQQIQVWKKKLNDVSLGMEHLFREVGKVYDFLKTESLLSSNPWATTLPRAVAECLIHGHTFELLDGDLSEISSVWFQAVCNEISQAYPNINVGVISIIGLKSTGKSTLLNALFGCKFAVSEIGCTRGIFLRFVFLEKKFAKEFNVQALVIVDTEGLCAPEVQNDVDTLRKDMRLATFALGISHVSIINVFWKRMKEIFDILQIAIVALARLSTVQMAPGLIMVQHVSERESGKLEKAKEQFGIALQTAVYTADRKCPGYMDKDMSFGVHNSETLKNLAQSTLIPFPPFHDRFTINSPPSEHYHDAVLALRKTIFDMLKTSGASASFKTWYLFALNAWTALEDNGFALRFRNIEGAEQFMELSKKITQTKEKIFTALREHRYTEEIEIRRNIQQWKENKQGLQAALEKTVDSIPHACASKCVVCVSAFNSISELFQSIDGKPNQHEIKCTIDAEIKSSATTTMNELIQIVDTLIIEYDFSGKFQEKITDYAMEEKINNEALSSSYIDATELEHAVNNVWDKVVRDVMTVCGIPASAEGIVTADAYSVYNQRPFLVNEIREGKEHNLKTTKAFDKGEINLSPTELTEYLYELKTRIPHAVAKDAVGYEKAMLVTLYNLVDNFLQEKYKLYQSQKSRRKMENEFKWDCHSVALKSFLALIIPKFQKWNNERHPLHLLEKNAATYKTQIRTSLHRGAITSTKPREEFN